MRMEHTAQGLFQAHHGDYVVLATFSTPTEAYIVKGCLEAAGIHAVIADDHLVQADSLLTIALGGVRLRVQEKKLTAAKQVLSDFYQGAFILDDPDICQDGTPLQTAQTAVLSHPNTSAASDEQAALKTANTIENLSANHAHQAIWSPDSAAFWSLAFTPIFGSVLHVINASRLGQRRLLVIALIWLAINTYCTNYLIWHIPIGGNMFETFINQCSALLPLMAVWYVLGVRPQSSYTMRHAGVLQTPQSQRLRLALLLLASVLSVLRLSSWAPG